MRSRPLAIDLFCGLGGWTEGLILEGYDVIGFDIERHVYGVARYPEQLVIQDVTTLHGRQLRDAALIVASPPCQAYSYRAMPWKRAKALPPPDNTLFKTCFRLREEASDAAGRWIPLVVENVRGAQPYVGRARWRYGSFFLWGDVPALMPITRRPRFKTEGHPNIRDGHPHTRHLTNPAQHGIKDTYKRYRNGRDVILASTAYEKPMGIESIKGANLGWFNDAKRKGGADTGRLSRSSSHSLARRVASAHIAKIPIELARHIGRAWYPALACAGVGR